MSEKEKEAESLQPVWTSMLSASLRQTLILSYLNKKFPGAIQDMSHEFAILSNMIAIQPEVREDVAKTLDGMPKTNEEDNPFRIISNEIMTETVIQTLMLRYLIKSNPDMAKAMLEDFRLVLTELELNETVKERVASSLSEFLPGSSS